MRYGAPPGNIKLTPGMKYERSNFEIVSPPIRVQGYTIPSYRVVGRIRGSVRKEGRESLKICYITGFKIRFVVKTTF
jgi:hypothetical protein